MNEQNYHCSITTNISAREAVENINHVSEWWTKNFEGNSEKLNDIFTVHFGETFATFQVIEVVPNKKIVWQVIDCYLDWLKDKKRVERHQNKLGSFNQKQFNTDQFYTHWFSSGIRMLQ